MFLGVNFTTVKGQVIFCQRPFEKCAGIDTGRRMRLKVNQIAGELRIAGAEEMVEADFKQIGGRRITGNVTAEFAIGAIGAHHHCQRIPAHHAGQMLFDRLGIGAARKRRFLFMPDGVGIGRVARIAPVDTPLLGRGTEARQQKAGTIRPHLFHYALQRLQPLLGFFSVDIDVFGEPTG